MASSIAARDDIGAEDRRLDARQDRGVGEGSGMASVFVRRARGDVPRTLDRH